MKYHILDMLGLEMSLKAIGYLVKLLCYYSMCPSDDDLLSQGQEHSTYN